MVFGVGKGLGLDMVTGKGTNHPSLQEIKRERPNLDEIPKKNKRDKTKRKRKQKKTQRNPREGKKNKLLKEEVGGRGHHV